MRNFTKSLFLFGATLLLGASSAMAQFGCGSAIVVTDGYTATGITTPGTGGPEDWNDNPTGTSINSSYWDDDVYLFEYTAGATAEQISMTIFTNNTWTGIGIFDDCTGTTFSTELDAAGGSSSSGIPLTVSTSIAAGNTVYIAVGQWGTPNDLDFDVTDFSVVTCLNPTAINVTGITTTTADINWTSGSVSTTSWDVSVVAQGSSPVNGTGVGTNPYNVTGLTPDTDYDVYVRDICGPGDSSSWVGPISFATPCTAITPAYLTDFATFLPSCWDEATDGDLTTGPTGLGTGSWFQSGTMAQINLYTTGTSDWLVSPGFDLSSGGWELVLEASTYDYGASPGTFSGMGSDDSVQVVISTDGGATWSSLYTFDISNQPASVATDYIIDLSAYTGTNNQFGVLATEGASDDAEDYYVNVHSFEIRQPLSCADPTLLTVTNIMATSADLNWTAGNPVQLGWEVSIVPNGNMPVSGTSSGINSYNATSLTANTSYDAYVREICSVGDTTAWLGPIPFTTPCAPFDGDDSTTPLMLSGLNPSATGSTASCFTDQSVGGGFSHDAPDAWYEYTLDNCADSLIVSLCGSAFDTYLTIYAADATTVIAYNDDNSAECGPGNNSHLELDIAATAGLNGGDLIYIVVDGYGSNSGTYSLNVNTILGAPVTTTAVNGSEITADATGVSYQWLDCGNGNAVITGETAQTFVAPLSGNYAVEINDAGCIDTSACEAITVATADLIITEINYNGAESGTDSTEFIEVYNNGASTVNMSGYNFTQGVTFTAGPNTLVPAGDYIVFAVDSSAMVNVYGYSGAYIFTGGLSNSGEDIVLVDPLGNVVDTVNYDDAAPWPSGFSAGEPDGGGASLILCDYSTDNNDGSNWSVATTATGVNINGLDVLGSPGAANTCIIECPSAFSVTACDTYTVPSGNETYTMSGVYMDTILGSTGCDSVMTITLTINNSTSFTDVQTACDSLVWNGTTYNASGTYTWTGTNAVGCDSVVTLDLTINNSSTTSVTETACDSLVWNGMTYTSSGTYTWTGTNATGCDSVVTLDLTINNAAATSVTETACDSLVWNGMTYTTSGTYTWTGTTVTGCDSVVTLDLTINTVDVTVTNNDPSITANATGATYQWIDCDDNNAAISGETGQMFTASANGNYAVIVTENGCVDTSACQPIVTVSLDEVSPIDVVTVYPNPVKNVVNVNLAGLENAQVRLLDMSGKVLRSEKCNTTELFVMEMKEAPGAYIIEVQSNDFVKQFKLIKE